MVVNAHENVFIILIYLLTWAAPIVLALWFVRTLSSMATVQREIARRLEGIESHLQGRHDP